MNIMNDIAIYVGWLTMAVTCWVLGWCLWQIIKELAEKLYWKAKVKTLHYKLYIRNVAMFVMPVNHQKFMISFKCEGYEDWFFYVNAKSWKEIGAKASQRWGDYLAEREKAITVVDNPKGVWEELFRGPVEMCGNDLDGDYTEPGELDLKAVKSWEYYGEGGLESYARQGNEPATDGGDICVGQERKTEEERS